MFRPPRKHESDIVVTCGGSASTCVPQLSWYSPSYTLCYLWTTYCNDVFERLMVAGWEICHSFHENVFTRLCHWVISWARWIQSTISCLISLSFSSHITWTSHLRFCKHWLSRILSSTLHNWQTSQNTIHVALEKQQQQQQQQQQLKTMQTWKA
jgi:hypothetical protein